VDPELIGSLLAFLITAALCAGCVLRARTATPRSRRLAGLALACGLVVLPALTLLAAARGPEGKVIFIALGAAVIGAELMAGALAVRSLRARRTDGGTARATPAAALVLSVLGGFMGLGMVLFPFVMAAGGPAARTPPWTHRVDPPGFELTLPSAAWQKVERAQGVAHFACRNPAMVAGVMDVRRAGSAAEFEAVVAEMKRLHDRHPVTVIEETREANPNGFDHWRSLGEENGANGRILVGLSVTWWNRAHAVVLLFEGQHRMASQTGQDQESEAFRAAARSILDSIK
jgi:hypothetical protein